MSLIMLPYTWRGKAFKTLTGLMRAVDRAYNAPCSISFDRDHMYVRCNGAVARYLIGRTDTVNAIESDPI